MRKIIPSEWDVSHEWDLSRIVYFTYKNKSFIWEWIHPTHVRYRPNAGEISLSWDDFSPYN